MSPATRMRAAGALYRARRRPPSVDQVLHARAVRILTDGLQHSPQAMRWASDVTGIPVTVQDPVPAVRFHPRELSLGAGRE